MFGQSIYLSVLNLAGRASNFLLYLLIANKFGTSQNTDWFFLVYAIIYYIITIFVRSVENALVPLLNKYGVGCAEIFLRTSILTGIWSIPGVTLATCFFGFIIVPMGFDINPPQYYSLSIVVCLILSIQPGIALLSSFFSSYLQARQRYTLPTIQLAIRSLGIIPCLIFPWCKSILCLAVAFLIGELTRLIVLGKIALPKIVQSKATTISPKVIAHNIAFAQIGWIALSLGSTQLNPAIDMAMVGGLGEGSVTLVNYVEKLRGFPILALNGIFVLLLGEWSKQHHKDAIPLTFQKVAKTSLIIISITSLFIIPLIVFIDTWLPVVFFSDQFTENEINILKKLFIFYSPGIPVLAGFFIVTNALLVYQKPKILALVALISIGLNIPFNLLFIEHFGIPGVALSTTCIDCIIFLIALASVKVVAGTS